MKKLAGILFGNPTILDVTILFFITWITLGRIENKIDKVNRHFN